MSSGGGGWEGLLTYFLTFVPEFKNDKIPEPHMSGGGEIWDKEGIANVQGPSSAPVWERLFSCVPRNVLCLKFIPE